MAVALKAVTAGGADVAAWGAAAACVAGAAAGGAMAVAVMEVWCLMPAVAATAAAARGVRQQSLQCLEQQLPCAALAGSQVVACAQ